MIIGDVNICGAAVASALAEVFVVDRTLWRKRAFLFPASGSNGTAEFFAGSVFFPADSGKLHFQSGRTQRQAVRAKCFIRLPVARIYRNERFGFEAFDDEFIKFAVIVSGIADKYPPFLLSVDSGEFFQQRFGYLAVSAVVGQRRLN